MAKLVLVNEEKAKRAKGIVALVLGKAVAKTEAEEDNQRKFSAMADAEGVDKEDSETLVQFVYEKLGGLVRTEAEEKEARRRKESLAQDKRKIV
jgi:hypothetical protein